jgi:phospholipid/cholesterol/gamma-HCH transport system ATP-binding protein
MMDTGAPDCIRVRDLVCGYGDLTVLRDIEFAVAEGEIFVILGGSGSGKSTLLRHMIGLMQPRAGTIEIAGERFDGLRGPDRARMLRRIGVLYQSGALFSAMTLAENVGLPLVEFTDLPPRAVREIASMKLGMVGLAGFEEYLPSEISGGMRKRAGVARALALDPTLLFFDEPSAGLDPISSAELDRLILGLRENLGTTIVIVTHELASIFAVADRCIVLDGARNTIVARGVPAELRDSSDDPFVRAFFRGEVMTAASGEGRG